MTLRETAASEVLFAPLLGRLVCKSNGNRPITDFFPERPVAAA